MIWNKIQRGATGLSFCGGARGGVLAVAARGVCARVRVLALTMLVLVAAFAAMSALPASSLCADEADQAKSGGFLGSFGGGDAVVKTEAESPVLSFEGVWAVSSESDTGEGDSNKGEADKVQIALFADIPVGAKLFAKPGQKLRVSSSYLSDIVEIDSPEANSEGYIRNFGLWRFEARLRDAGNAEASHGTRSEADEVAALPDVLTLEITYQLCSDEDICYSPRLVDYELAAGNLEAFAFVGMERRLSASAPSVELDDEAGSAAGVGGATDAGRATRLRSAVGGRTSLATWLLMLLFAVLGGFLLNLMPCVLPAIGIKLASMLGEGDIHTKRRESQFFALGMFFFVFVLGCITAVMRLAGMRLGWGFQFQSPLFSMLMISIMVVFGLSFFGFFTIGNFRFTQQGASIVQVGLTEAGIARASVRPTEASVEDKRQAASAQRKLYASAFAKGMLAAVLATPCSAPLLAPAVGFALSRGVLEILIFFAVIGVAFALPLLILSYAVVILGDKARRFLPKPGAWMELLKGAMGFLMFGVALYLMNFVIYQIELSVFIRFLGFLLGVSASIYMVHKLPYQYQQWGVRIVLILSIVIGLLLFVGVGPSRTGLVAGDETSEQTRTQMQEMGAIGSSELQGASALGQGASAGGVKSLVSSGHPQSWETYTPERRASLIAAKQPHLIICSAAWCSICKTNNRKVLYTQEALDYLRAKGIVVLYGDYTNPDPEIDKLLDEFVHAGVPLYLYFDGASYKKLPQQLRMSDILSLTTRAS